MGLAFFDPRFAIIYLPLFITYNARKSLASIKSLMLTVLVSNVPLLYPGMGLSFLQMAFSTGITASFYPYALNPLLTVEFLTFVNYKEVRKAVTDSLAKLRPRDSSHNSRRSLVVNSGVI